MVYLYNLLAVPLYYYIIRINAKNTVNSTKFFYFVVALHAILFRVLANPYNYVDIENYANAFGNIAEMSFNEAVFSFNIYSAWGVGYVALNWVVGQLANNALYLFAITTILSVGGTVYYYKKTSYLSLAPIMLYLLYPMMYFMSFGVIRQHISIPFILFALYYIDNLKYSIPLLIISILFHTGAVVFVPFYFLIYFYKKHSLKVSICFSLVMVVLMKGSVLFLLSFLPRYEETYEERESTNNIVPVFLIGFFLYLLYVSKIWQRIKCSNQKDYNVILFVFYGFFVSLFSIGMSSAGRLPLPFIYILPVAMTYLYKYNRKKVLFYHMYLAVFTSITLIFYYLSYKAGELYVYAYSFFWEPQVLYY